jgi:hypothetical protein
MIKGIISGAGIIASGGSMNYPYIPMNPNNPVQGMLRLNGQDMQTFDGSGWITVGASYANVSLDPESLDLLQWARKKRDEEMAWTILAKDNKAIKIALYNLEQARQQLDITAKLAREHEQV